MEKKFSNVSDAASSRNGLPESESGPTPKHRRTAFAFSFALPGLGQVYQGHYRRGAALFVAFSLLTVITEARWFLPLAAFLVAMEAYRGRSWPKRGGRKAKEVEADMPGAEHLPDRWRKALLKSPGEGRYRTSLFAIVGSLGFCAWLSVAAPMFYPFREQALINDQIDDLADRVRAYHVDHGEYPHDLNEVLPAGDSASEGLRKDPWGTNYGYRAYDEGFEVRSAGRDRKMNTGDDFIYRFR